MSDLIISKYKLSGLSCQACEKLISKRILTIPGVQKVSVSSTRQETEIEADRDINIAEISGVLADTDFKVISKETVS